MELLCLNKRCEYNDNCNCKKVYLYVSCFGLTGEDAKIIIEKHLKKITK